MGYQIKEEIFKILTDSLKTYSYAAPEEIKIYIVDKIMAMAPQEVNNQVVELINELGKRQEP